MAANTLDPNFETTAFKWLDQNELQYSIWNNKYRVNNESFDAWLDRVSGSDPKFRQLIVEKKVLPGGRTCANRGTHRGSLANCYSIGYVPDSLEGIMDVNSKIALTYKAQGGQGLSLSHIRPKGTSIHGNFQSDGIVPFMEVFNTTTNSISQGGSRKGALMISCDVWHKDIEQFITIKSKEGKIEKANLSVEIDDEFMKIIEDLQEFPQSKDVILRHRAKFDSGEIEYDVNVTKIWNTICEQALKHAEPGIIFTERFRNYNIMELCNNYQIETCNPCGEQPLPKHGCCNLMSINLSQYVKTPYTEDAYFDFISLGNDIYTIVKASDDIIDENLENHPLSEQRKMAETFRNCGIGIMGLADTFIKLGFVYGDNDSLCMAENIIKFIFQNAVIASATLGEERGNFPGYSPKVWDSQIIKENFSEKQIKKLKEGNSLRNCSLLSIAPTGSIGTMLGCSTGIECNFALSYNRRTESLNGEERTYPVFIKPIKEYREIYGESAKLPAYFIATSDVPYKKRLKMQAILQKSVDTAISSTLNLPKETTLEDIKNIYLQAWQLGLKGVTVYVDGSRNPILSTNNTPKVEEFKTTKAPKRPKVLNADFYKVKAEGKPFFVFVGLMNNKPYEVFALPAENIDTPVKTSGTITKIKKRHYSFKSNDGNLEFLNIALDEEFKEWRNITLHVSAMLRHGMPINSIMKIEDKCNDVITSFNKAIWKILSHYVDKEIEAEEVCPECGKPIIREGGCKHCSDPGCGWSACFLAFEFGCNDYD